MSRSNKLAFITLGFTGTLAIIGAGFSAWVFVGENSNVASQIDAGVTVTERLSVGRLHLVSEQEARSELNLPQYKYDLDENQYGDLKFLVNQYSYRKIVFSEGNPDSTALNDGMQFLRFYKDNRMGIKTFKEEKYIDGHFLVPASYQEKGISFHIGVRTLNIDVPPTGTKENLTIDDFIQLNNKFEPNIDEKDSSLKNYFELDGAYYSAFDNKNNAGLYEWKKIGQETVIKENGQSELCDKYYFRASLEQMFLYEPGMKPYNCASVERIYEAIKQAKKDGSIATKWRIQFEFASCLVQE